MLHYFLGLTLLMHGNALAGTPGAISVLLPKTGEWCLLGVDHIGPKELSVGEKGNYRIRIQNRSTCELRDIQVSDTLPRKFSILNSSPAPSGVEKLPDRKYGPVVYWNHIPLKPWESREFQVEVRANGKPNREAKSWICLGLPKDAEEDYCYYFKIRVRP